MESHTYDGLELEELRLMWRSAPIRSLSTMSSTSGIGPLSCEDDLNSGSHQDQPSPYPSSWITRDDESLSNGEQKIHSIVEGQDLQMSSIMEEQSKEAGRSTEYMGLALMKMEQRTPDAGPGPSSSTSGPAESEVPLDRLESQICALASRIAMSCCLWLTLIAEFDRRKGWAQWGVKSCAHWLSWSCSVSPAAAREYVRVAKDLRSLPLIRSAFAGGRLSYSKVRAITRVAARVQEQTLLEQALLHTASQLERVVRGFRLAEGAGLEQQRKRRGSWFWDEDGMFVLRARLPADEGAVLLAALQSAEHSLGTPVGDVVDGRCEPDSTSGIAPKVGSNGTTDLVDPAMDVLGIDSHQIGAADALVAMAQSALKVGPSDSSGDDRNMVVLHADARLLQGGSPESAECFDSPSDDDLRLFGSALNDQEPAKPASSEQFTSSEKQRQHQDFPSEMTSEPVPGSAAAWYNPWSGQQEPRLMNCGIENGPGVELTTAQRLACDAALMAVLWASHAAAGEELSLGRKTRKISAPLRRALRIRDGGCRFPGCHRRRHLEAHHVVHWLHGGSTDLINLVLLCRVHHMALHEGGFKVARGSVSGPSLWRFSRPDGVEIPRVRPLNPLMEADSPSDGQYSRSNNSDMKSNFSMPTSDVMDDTKDAELIRPGWRGERFSLVDSVGVWCQSALEYDLVAGGPS